MTRLTLCLLLGLLSQTAGAQTRIYVHLDSSFRRSFTGRLFVHATSDTAKGVPNETDYRQPTFALQVRDWTPGRPVVINDSAEAFSVKPSAMQPGFYKLVAFLDAHPELRGSGNPGNVYSRKDALLEVRPGGVNETHIHINAEIKPRPFRETDTLKLLDLSSPLLSAFHKKEVRIRAAVLLPAEYHQQPGKTYPVVYIIPGWGGTHFDAQGAGPRKRYGIGTGLPKIYVYLNPEDATPWGLHAFVDSRVNGPWGRALVEEVLPHVQQAYRASREKTFLIGHSSGGYPAVWLPLHYPKAFAGTWAVSPDPLDFSSFTGIDLYAPDANFYVDSRGDSIGLDIRNGKYQQTIKRSMDIERYNDDGGQQTSFEAVYGVPGADGRPRPLFDRATGRVDPSVVADWKRYDLGRWMKENGRRAARELKGRIHVYAGAQDNFNLHLSVQAFGKKAALLKQALVTELIPGADHWSVWSPAFTLRVQKELEEAIGR
ncbi:MAG TPA: alpha/beta hydrolase-fold protein [Chitinophagaceae bacterium]|jgi:S-formylglutathione hydrolase FrmB|nr:alpha/beta hydrolase-fold protein [Chitinophagaceae bacterium]